MKKIVIIDSGYSGKNSKIIGGSWIKKEKNKIIEDVDYSDNIIHGTLITNIFLRNTNNCEFYILKIFDDNETDVDLLIYALYKIYNELNPFLIHMSIGIGFSEKIKKLHNIIKKLYKKNIIMIASFSNDGSISYPAYFDEVIGVSSQMNGGKISNFYFCNNLKINIIMNDVTQRIKYYNNNYYYVNGSSFLSPYISCEIINKCEKMTFNEILFFLKSLSFKTIDFPNHQYIKKFKIKKNTNAVIFPYIKETNTILRESKYTNINIIDIYDFPQFGKIGKLINNYKIKNIYNLNLENIDLIIVGHLDLAYKYISKNYFINLFKKIKKYKIKVYSFSNLDYLNLNFKFKYYYPKINKNNIPFFNHNKLHTLDIPSICIAGTSSKQGKFTLEIKLINLFKKNKYNVLSILTEPSGYLLDNSLVFNIGYNSDISLSNDELISIINEEINHAQKTNDFDLIITGTQSQCIPLELNNLEDIPKYNEALIYGVNPDYYILCVNINENVENIIRHIKYLESITISKVICLAFFPFIRTTVNIGNAFIKNNIYEIKQYVNFLKKYFSLPIYDLTNDKDIMKIYNLILKYLLKGE